MRLVLDTNVLVSAFLWQGTLGRLVELAGEKECRLFTSRVLIVLFTPSVLNVVLHNYRACPNRQLVLPW